MLNFLLFALVGVLFIALGVPLYLGKVPPNHWYGFRNRDTMADKTLWYEVNATGGRDFAWLGVVVLVLTVILRLFLQPNSQIFAAVMAVVILVGTFVCLVHGTTPMRRVRERPDDIGTG